MKKVFYIFGILAMGILASCQKDPVENTACVDMAGDWYVTIDAAKNGQVVYEDVYDLGYVHMFTSNTAADIATEMILTDNRDDPFWDFKVKAAAEPNGMTFSAIDAQNLSYDCKVSVTNAKIVKNGGVQNNGSPADLISMDVTFSDDDDALVYHLEGVRYSGLKEND